MADIEQELEQEINSVRRKFGGSHIEREDESRVPDKPKNAGWSDSANDGVSNEPFGTHSDKLSQGQVEAVNVGLTSHEGGSGKEDDYAYSSVEHNINDLSSVKNNVSQAPRTVVRVFQEVEELDMSTVNKFSTDHTVLTSVLLPPDQLDEHDEVWNTEILIQELNTIVKE